MSRGDSPADVQMARSFVAVVAGLVFAGCLSCHDASGTPASRLPPEIRAVAMILGGGADLIRSIR